LLYRWDFGDGTESVQGANLPAVSHTFLENGRYTVELTVSDGVSRARATLAVSVTNVAPDVSLKAPSAIDEGNAIDLVGSFTDPGLTDSHTAIVNWKDGSLPEVVAIDVTAASIHARHRYLEDGQYDVTLS